MLLENVSSQNSSESQWPNCPNIADVCPVYNMAKALGTDVQNILINFISEAEDGSRLTLQKNQTGFTIQVTGAVKRGSENGKTLDIASLRSIGHKLNREPDL